MSKMNLHDDSKSMFGFCAVVTNATTGTSKTIDRKGYNGVEFHFAYGLTASAADAQTVVIYEGDTSGAMTSVADTYLQGTEAAAGRPTGTATTSGIGQNHAKSIGYTGNKRFVKAIVTPTDGITSVCSCIVQLYNPEVGATTQQGA